MMISQVIRNAKLWCDVESAEEAEHLSNEWEYSLVPGFTASKILWLKNKEPEHFARLRQVLLPHDFLNYHLTGRYCMEVKSSPISQQTVSAAVMQSALKDVLHSAHQTETGASIVPSQRP